MEGESRNISITQPTCEADHNNIHKCGHPDGKLAVSQPVEQAQLAQRRLGSSENSSQMNSSTLSSRAYENDGDFEDENEHSTSSDAISTTFDEQQPELMQYLHTTAGRTARQVRRRARPAIRAAAWNEDSKLVSSNKYAGPVARTPR